VARTVFVELLSQSRSGFDDVRRATQRLGCMASAGLDVRLSSVLSHVIADALETVVGWAVSVTRAVERWQQDVDCSEVVRFRQREWFGAWSRVELGSGDWRARKAMKKQGKDRCDLDLGS
jgi:hypothetical protein